MMNHPYVIWTWPYNHASAGLRSLHLLCHLMNESGIEAYVTNSVVNPKWNTPVARNKNLADCIVIYSEIWPGNTLNARNVVRYVMQKPGLLGGDKEYDPSEMVIYYSRQISDKGPYLTVPSIESDLFRPFPKYRRKGALYYLGPKSKNKPDPAFVQGMTEITREWPAEREELADLLKRSEVLYTWDAMTALSLEATMCGCPCVIMDEGYWKRSDIEKGEFGMAGIAWGEGELEHARKTVHEAPANYEKVERLFKKQLVEFVEQSQARFVPGSAKNIFRDKLRVSCFMDNKDNGSNYYRAVLPLSKVAKLDPDVEVMFVRNGDEEKKVTRGFDTDVFFLPRIANPQTFKAFQSFSFAPVVCDYDDNLFAVSPLSPHYQGLGIENAQYRTEEGTIIPIWEHGKNIDLNKNKETLARITTCIHDAKAVTVTTELLADAYRPINKRVVALPNLIDLSIWQRLPLDNNGTIRLFWAGGSSHYEDWLLLRNVLPRVMLRYPQTRLVLMGAKWDATLKGIPEDRIEFHQWVHSEAYPYKVAILNPDIALIPLRENLFSKGKSPIKFIEMGALGVPSVMSAVSPYNEIMTEDNGIFIEENDETAWEEGISLLIEKEATRKEVGINARAYVEENFDVNVHYKLYADFFKGIA